MNNQEIILQGRLNGRQHNRLKSLLDMMYKPSELADEIGINKNQIYRVYLKLGCPHERDQKNRIWINGKHFREWYQNSYKKKKLKANQAYCRTCGKGVAFVNIETHTKDGLIYQTGNCIHCERKVSRILDQKRG